jgi:hypothetical protein
LISCYYNLYLHEYKNKTNIKEIDYNVLSEIPIDIFSPAFNLISQEKIFEEIFTVLISIDLIEAFNLKKDYMSFFEKMNKSNSSLYSILFNYKSNNDFDYLKEFNANFDNMERLSIVRVQYALRNSYDHLLRNFFLLKNLEKSLIYLKLDLNRVII